ncbi:ASB2 [Symbiodinium sp. CCMP2592]|nr:ASB2 [Symbiodinium sp. CCMP2592]
MTARLELCRGYLALFFLKSKAGPGYSLWEKLSQLLYKQSAPNKWWALLLEDAPQAFIASLISLADGLKPFTLAVNLLIPFVRLSLAWNYHDHIAWEVQAWLKNEALDADAAGRPALRDEYIAALRRLEDVAQERGWGGTILHDDRELLRTLLAAWSAGAEARWRFCSVALMDDTWLQNGPPGPCNELRLDLSSCSLELREFTEELPKPREARLAALQAPRGRLPREVVLALTDCDLGDEGCRVLCESLRQIGGGCEEFVLELRGNTITAKGAELLAEGFGEMKALTKLELEMSYNPELGDAGCQALCRSLRQMSELRSLDLDLWGTGLGAEGCAAVAAALGELRLQELKLMIAYNAIPTEALEELRRQLRNHIPKLKIEDERQRE